jgi:hypothetical protein
VPRSGLSSEAMVGSKGEGCSLCLLIEFIISMYVSSLNIIRSCFTLRCALLMADGHCIPTNTTLQQLILRGKAGRSHNTGHKGRKRINRLAASAPITEKAIEGRMRRIIREM